MSQKILGIDLFRVTPTPIHELGMEATDIKGGEGVLTIFEFLHPPVGAGAYQRFTSTRVFDPHGVYRYVRANAANILRGDGVQRDVTASEVTIPHNVVEVGAANQIVEGVTMEAIPNTQFGWIQVRGKHFDVNVADAVADDADLDTAANGSFVVAAALSLAQVNSWLSGVKLVKIADRSTLFPGAVDRGICMLRS